MIRIFWSLFSDKSVYKCSAVAEMGNRLATIDMDRKLGAVHLLGGKLGPHVTQCGLGRGLPSYQVASSSIQPFSHNRHGPKFGRLCPLGVELGPHLAQCCPGRGLPSYHRTDPLSALYSRCSATNREVQPTSTRIRR